MNSSLRFVSLVWESSFLLLFPQFRFHFVSVSSTSTPPHLQNSLTHYTKSTRSSLLFVFPLLRLPMDIGCPVSCKFPHGTLHYQSRYLSSSLAGGSALFHPHFMYGFTRTFLASFDIRDYLPFGLFTLFLVFHFWLLLSFPQASQFRSPLLSGSRLISFSWY